MSDGSSSRPGDDAGSVELPPWARPATADPDLDLDGPAGSGYAGAGPVVGAPLVPPERQTPLARPAEVEERWAQAIGNEAVAAHPLGVRPAAASVVPGGSAPADSALPRVAVGGKGGRSKVALHRIDPWSTLKLAFVLSLCLLVVTVIAVAVLCVVLTGMGVFSSVNETLGTVTDDSVQLTAKVLIVGSAVVGAVNVVILTALATVSAFLYNVCAELVGGAEITLTDAA